jgi:hypothetical protein
MAKQHGRSPSRFRDARVARSVADADTSPDDGASSDSVSSDGAPFDKVRHAQ